MLPLANMLTFLRLFSDIFVVNILLGLIRILFYPLGVCHISWTQCNDTKGFTHCIVRPQSMMVKASYSDTANHKVIHNGFLAKIKSLKAPLDDASIKWAKEWWVSSLFLS